MKTASAASCPYAQAIHEEEQSVSSESLPGKEELQACPAFRNKECPFKGLDAEALNQKLQEMPPSHLQSNGIFYKTLAFFHRQQATATDAVCPVKHALPVDMSFDDAMEQFSLASLISRLALEIESKNRDGEDSSSSFEPASPAAVPSADRRHSASLSDALKSGTVSAHEAAENVHFVKNFIRGKIDRNLYGLLVAQLFHVYTRLEQALDKYAPSHFGKCHFPKELARTEALQEDVEFWHTTSSPAVSPATQDYLDRIEYLEKTNPLLLLSHAYTRYLGDLSGGKVLARVARRALNLKADDEGLAFYHFEHVKSFKLFKDKYRGSLNALDLSEQDIAALVQEANIAFLLNMRLFEELDVLDNVPGATVRPLKEVYGAPRSPKAAGELTAEEAKCPFLQNKAENASVAHVSAPTTKHSAGGVCPWPFILLHDPKTGMKKWQTWFVIGLVLLFVYQAFTH